VMRCICALLLLAPAFAASGQGLYVETDGLVAIEIESHPPTKGWVKETAVDGFTGAAYYRWDGGNRYGGASGDSLAFRILIITPGTYQFRYRTYREGGCDEDFDGG